MKAFSSDPYCYPGTNLLRNLKDIRDASELEAFEYGHVCFRLFQFTVKPLTDRFDVVRLRKTHRHIFQDVYAWAGELRADTGTMTKQRPSGTVITYADSAYIEAALKEVFDKLDKESTLRGLALPAFAIRAAHYYGELDAIHPFREGNSRTLRQFFSDLARNAGYTLDWSHLARDEAGRLFLFQARDLAVLRGDSSLLARIFEAGLRPL